MQIVILGASNVGVSLAKRLSKHNDVVLVDVDASAIVAKRNINVVCVDGVIIDMSVLAEAGLKDCDVVCALSSNENMNLMASQIAKKKFNVKKVISCVYDNEEYRMFEELGVVPISQTELTVEQFSKEINDTFTAEKGLVSETSCSMFGRNYRLKLFEPGKEFIGTRVKQINDSDGGFIFGLMRNGDIVKANPEDKIENGDRLITCIPLD